MQAAIAVFFRIGNIVLPLEQFYVVLPKEHITECIDVLRERANDADACHVK